MAHGETTTGKSDLKHLEFHEEAAMDGKIQFDTLQEDNATIIDPVLEKKIKYV